VARDAVINMRISKRDLDLISRAADVEGKTLSSFLRDCAEKTALAVFPAEVGERCPVCGNVKSK
jgi:uncharacterized protein (DUF1778 family)